MIDYNYYPFLNGASRTITSFEEQSILYARDNLLENGKYTPTKQLSIDIPVWLISTIMLRCVNNNYLTRKFVSNYGKLFESVFLKKDIHNKHARMEVLEYFLGIVNNKDIEFLTVRTQPFLKIHVNDYLEISLDIFGLDQMFKLSNQVLERGYVIIEVQRFVYLLRLALEYRLFEKIKGMKEYKDNELINRCVNELIERYPRFDKYQAPSKNNIPESIKTLIDRAYSEHHLSHRERIRLGIYLQSYNFDMDFILDIFRQLSDWNEKVTRYQLQSLKKYIHK